MRTRKEFIKDGLTLTLTALILRSAGVLFSARLSAIAGASVMGLYTQIMNVYAFAVTASAAGINLGAMRTFSECYGKDRLDGLSSAMRTCIGYCIRNGIMVGAVMLAFAPFLGNTVLGDARAIAPLCALAPALPFIAIGNAFHGYFNGVKQISRSAFTSLIEQAVRILSTLFVLEAFRNATTEALCLILVICNAASEAFSCVILALLYRLSLKKAPKQRKYRNYLKARFIGITVPIAVSSLVRSALTTTEHLLIPICLRKNGLDYESSLAKYGIVSGMALPVLLYPMALLSSFASITIAELSARASSGECMSTIRATVSRGLSFALLYGIGCSAIIMYLSTPLGYALYNSAEAGDLIRILSPLIFFMYLDHISDGMLKGLDKQNYVMKVNILDASLSVLFAILLIPRFGIYGFIASLYLCECLNCFFSFGRLFIMIKPELTMLHSLFLPLSAAIISIKTVSVLSIPFGGILALIGASALLYILLLKLTGALCIFSHPSGART